MRSLRAKIKPKKMHTLTGTTVTVIWLSVLQQASYRAVARALSAALCLWLCTNKSPRQRCCSHLNMQRPPTHTHTHTPTYKAHLQRVLLVQFNFQHKRILPQKKKNRSEAAPIYLQHSLSPFAKIGLQRHFQKIAR